MTATDTHGTLRDAIRRTLDRHIGGARDASAVAEATVITWRQVAAQLAPVIGVRGVDVLFSRSLHLTSTTYVWLALARNHEDAATLLTSFKERLEARGAVAAAEASLAVLLTFTDLLATLIGESLTERLLGPVWASPPKAFAEETAP